GRAARCRALTARAGGAATFRAGTEGDDCPQRAFPTAAAWAVWRRSARARTDVRERAEARPAADRRADRGSLLRTVSVACSAASCSSGRAVRAAQPLGGTSLRVVSQFRACDGTGRMAAAVGVAGRQGSRVGNLT